MYLFFPSRHQLDKLIRIYWFFFFDDLYLYIMAFIMEFNLAWIASAYFATSITFRLSFKAH